MDDRCPRHEHRAESYLGNASQVLLQASGPRRAAVTRRLAATSKDIRCSRTGDHCVAVRAFAETQQGDLAPRSTAFVDGAGPASWVAYAATGLERQRVCCSLLRSQYGGHMVVQASRKSITSHSPVRLGDLAVGVRGWRHPWADVGGTGTSRSLPHLLRET
jgi:hypothetical protein